MEFNGIDIFYILWVTTISWILSFQISLIYFRKDLQLSVVSETYTVWEGRAVIFHYCKSKFKSVRSTTHTDTQENTHTLLTDNES